MNSMLEWRLAARNLKRNPRRTLSTAVALVVAYIGVALLAGHVIRSEKTLKAHTVYVNRVGHVSVYKKGGIDNFDIRPDKYEITETELAALTALLQARSGEVERSGAFLWTVGLLSAGQRTIPVFVEGLEPDLDGFLGAHPRVKQYAEEMTSRRSPVKLSEVVASAPDAISISRGVGELIDRTRDLRQASRADLDVVIAGRTIEGDLNAVNATLATHHTTGTPYLEDMSVIAPLSLARELMATKGSSRVSIFLNENERSAAESFAASLQSAFDAENLDLEALPFTDDRIGLYYTGTMRFLLVMIGFFSVLIFGASALILVNSMTMSIMERSREMGTLRALGYAPDRVRSLFVKEAFWLSLFASVSGIALSEAIGAAIGGAGIYFESAGFLYPLRLRVLIEPWFHATTALVLIGIATGCSAWIVTKTCKERVSTLLLESGAVI